MVFKIRYKSFSVYLQIRDVAVETILRYGPENLTGWSDNLSFKSKVGKESEKATKRYSL